MRCLIRFLSCLLFFSGHVLAQIPVQVEGVFPHLAIVAEHEPNRSEIGIGALMPWANRLWAVTYVAHLAESGGGSGLFEIDENLAIKKRPESVNGTYANRMIHAGSNQLIIGPHAIDTKGNVRTFPELGNHRLTATMEHLTKPEEMVYFLTMEGLLFEANVHNLNVNVLCNLLEEPQLNLRKGIRPHFKGGYTAHGRVVVANNTLEESDYMGQTQDGLLAEWDGKTWTVLDRSQWLDITGRKNLSEVIFATGADNASIILKAFIKGKWQTYRLPKATHTQDHTVTTEWPRIREVESERFMMNVGGMFYELPPMAYGGHLWGIKPICQHLRIIGDYCSWRGLLVVAGDQTTPVWDKNLFVGQPQSNFWFGKTDDLWRFGGKPAGWGGPWLRKAVNAGEPSEPYLMTGFDKKVLHILHQSDRPVSFMVEVDFVGDGTWVNYQTLKIGAKGYLHHEFPDGFSAHWVRITADKDCTATAYFIYN
jgi:hypothetical protein